MDIINLIKHYIFVFNGSYKGVYKRTKEDLRAIYPTATETVIAEKYIKTFNNMLCNGVIEPIPYNQMNEQQKRMFDAGDEIYQCKK